MKAFTTICALIAVPLAAYAGDDAAKKAPAAGAPAPVKQAEPPAPPPMPTPAKELDAAKGFAKNWTCTGTNSSGDKSTAKLAWKVDLDKFWYAVRMDVVKNNIANLSGIIDLQTERGRGTRFEITLPVTLAIIRALVVSVAGRIYAVPLNSGLQFGRAGVKAADGQFIQCAPVVCRTVHKQPVSRA